MPTNTDPMAALQARAADAEDKLASLELELASSLSACKHAIRVREDGGIENLAASVAVTLTALEAKLDKPATAADWQARAEKAEAACAEWRAAVDSIRDSVLHERHQLEGCGLDSDTINAVLDIIDDATPDQDAGSGYVIRAELDAANAACAAMRMALERLHAKLSESCNVYFEQDGKPINICTDLGEAYQESELCEKAYAALHSDAGREYREAVRELVDRLKDVFQYLNAIRGSTSIIGEFEAISSKMNAIEAALAAAREKGAL